MTRKELLEWQEVGCWDDKKGKHWNDKKRATRVTLLAGIARNSYEIMVLL